MKPFLLSPKAYDLIPRELDLVVHTLLVLERADLGDVRETLVACVLGPTPSTRAGDDRDARLVTCGHLTPFVQLLLFEVAFIARQARVSRTERRRRVLDTIELAGF